REVDVRRGAAGRAGLVGRAGWLGARTSWGQRDRRLPPDPAYERRHRLAAVWQREARYERARRRSSRERHLERSMRHSLHLFAEERSRRQRNTRSMSTRAKGSAALQSFERGRVRTARVAQSQDALEVKAAR